MNLKLVSRLVGRVLLVEAFFMLLPLAVALLYQEDPAPFLLTILLMAILKKGKGLVWGAAEGALFAGLLFILGTLYQSEWETMQFVRAGLVLLMGVLGGILGMLRAERKRR
jgi:Trk-type K+ transport system membrane component